MKMELLCLVDHGDLDSAYRLCPLWDRWAQETEGILNRITECSNGVDENSENSKRDSEHPERQAGKT